MELHEDLQHATSDYLSDNLDEKLARIRYATTLILIGVAIIGVYLAKWILNLEGRM